MSTTLQSVDRILQAFSSPNNGIVGLVDDLLVIASDHAFRLNWENGQAQVQLIGIDAQDVVEIPVRKSVFRAALARIAVVCNDHSSKSVSPYGGQGEISIGTNPVVMIQVAFANTPDDQSLDLVRSTPEKT